MPRLLTAIASQGQRGHSGGMERATHRPAAFTKPAHWSNDPAPAPAPPEPGDERGQLDPTRYGDWEKNGIAIDF